jgi:tetratricopeptide (TPR) repeat protein
MLKAIGPLLGAICLLNGCRQNNPRIEDLLANYREESRYEGVTIVHPFEGALFPRDIAPPVFRWQETDAKSDFWVITFQFAGSPERLSYLSSQSEWTPAPPAWDQIKSRSLEKRATVAVLGFKRGTKPGIQTGGRVHIQTSKDEVIAPLFYREVNLPFEEAVKDPTRIRWRFGSIASPQAPPVVLENVPVCGNCHSFPRDGRTLAMDVDYANSKGSYVLTQVAPKMELNPRDIITWDDYRREDNVPTFGLLSQISPDGRWVASTVKDNSVFVPKPDLAFSQLFFPVKGILGLYDRQNRKFSSLPGADDPQYVQSNPSWSPDGRYLLFARTQAYRLKQQANNNRVLLSPDECAEFLKDGKPFAFDLYRLPFNQGQGGTPEPVIGAATNGFSNYFPRYSPDGKWIIFCRAKNYMLLQPDSELYIIPAEGGVARRLKCNLSRMNSWHSWSPNGKWLVFSSKGLSLYTQLFLTHIDEQGESSPPVCLSHFTAPDRAANIPEFVNLEPGAITRIQAGFLNDYSFVRAGNEFYRAGDPQNAIRQYQQALKCNPQNADAYQRLGFLLYHVQKQPKEGLAYLQKALQINPNHAMAHYDLGMALSFQDNPGLAVNHLRQAIKLMPDGLDKQYNALDMRMSLAETLVRLGNITEAIACLREVVKRDPQYAPAHYQLAMAAAAKGTINEALAALNQAINADPKIDQSPDLHRLLGTNYARDGQVREAMVEFEKARQLAQAQGKIALAQNLSRQIDALKKSGGAKPF